MNLTSWNSVLLLVLLATAVTIIGVVADYRQGKCLPIRRSRQLVTSLSVLFGGFIALGGGVLYAAVRYLQIENELSLNADLVRGVGIGLLMLLVGSVIILLLPTHSSNR